MKPIFCIFERSFDRHPIEVNVNLILYLEGNDDGTTARTLIEQAGASVPAKVKVSLAIRKIPDLKTALVWGTLPGATDETIYITAHKDGWFEGASDNAGGVASMLGLAEYFAKIPKARRKRTMIFIGLDGHHNGSDGALGVKYLTANKAKLFARTALLINDEHPSTIFTQSRPRYYPGDELAWADTAMPLQWYGGGKERPVLEKIMRDFAEAAGPAWVLQPGKMVFEIRPSRADKGEAVASYLEQPPFLGRLPVAVGDDLTDESMFALANARGGQSIRVGSLSTATCALAKSSSPSAIRSALATIGAAGARKEAAAS